MLIYDSHCHLDDALTHSQHITPALIPGIKLDDAASLVNLRYNYPLYKIGFGIHPWYINQSSNIPEITSELEQLILKYHPDFIGEIGLDYLKPNIELQKEILNCQLELAKKYALPVILHCVKAYNDLLMLLKQHRISFGIVHAFNANATIAQTFINNGFLLGIGSLITKNSLIRNNLTQIPLNKIVLESDAPFMPAFNKDVSCSSDTFLYAQIIAKQYKINLIDLINQSNQNIKNLFKDEHAKKITTPFS